MLRRLYDWVLSWAEKRHGPQALSAISFAEASFFPVPPDPLLMALCLGKPEKSYRFGLYCSIFSVLGALAGYIIGYGFWEIVDSFFLSHIATPDQFELLEAKYNENAFWAIVLAGFTPIPFKAFTVTSGVFKVDILIFTAACILGRTARFMVIASLLSFFGERMKLFIEKYFNIFSVLFFILLVAGILFFRKIV